jgi:hypothetical protein
MSDEIPIGVPVSDLRPTQMTVGIREVEHKRKQWRDASTTGRAKLLREHVVPAVIGPKDRPYIVDHHHFARALLEENAGLVAIYVLADLSQLPKRNFWTYLDNSAWCHAYDERGRRRELSDIPKRLEKLADDPFRSLAGALIRAGACAKSSKPFSEFLWADFLRHRIDGQLVASDYDKALRKALKLARNEEAKSLPGWCAKNNRGL